MIPHTIVNHFQLAGYHLASAESMPNVQVLQGFQEWPTVAPSLFLKTQMQGHTVWFVSQDMGSGEIFSPPLALAVSDEDVFLKGTVLTARVDETLKQGSIFYTPPRQHPRRRDIAPVLDRKLYFPETRGSLLPLNQIDAERWFKSYLHWVPDELGVPVLDPSVVTRLEQMQELRTTVRQTLREATEARLRQSGDPSAELVRAVQELQRGAAELAAMGLPGLGADVMYTAAREFYFVSQPVDAILESARNAVAAYEAAGLPAGTLFAQHYLEKKTYDCTGTHP